MRLNTRNFILFFIAICLHAIVSAQQRKPMPGSSAVTSINNSPYCGSDKLMEQLRKGNDFAAAEVKMNNEILRYNRNLDTSIITLPVVVHIINTNPAAVSNSVITNAIKDLNDAFSKSGAYAASAGADTRIRFCLANKDPEGGVTNGITRTTSFFSNNVNTLIEDRKLKDLIQWDPTRYINIWLVTNLYYEIFFEYSCGKWIRMNAGGYATMPPGGGPLDGIVVTAFGPMLAHEMGHYLGLYHTFEGSCGNGNCLVDGDKVCDTPPDASVRNSASCSSPDNSCFTDTVSGFTVDMPDQIANFMDYGNDPCHNQFTQGQADRMRAAINTQRPGLLQNQCTPPCTDNIVASFTRSNAYPTPGNTITFTNTSTGAINYEWLVNNVVVANTPNFTYTFTSLGKVKITMKAYSSATCYASHTDYVLVTCGVSARFYTDKRFIASLMPQYPDSIRFTNTSENATAYQWIISNDAGMAPQVVSTGKDLIYVFPTPGNYTIKLIASNGGCSDTTDGYLVPVANPLPDAMPYVYDVKCFQETSVRLTFFVCNYGFAPLPRNTPISFYDADPRLPGAIKLTTYLLPDTIQGNCCSFLYTIIIDAGRRGLNKLYLSINDAGTVNPVVFPATPLLETNYFNNVQAAQNFAFKVNITPAISVAEPGDTLQFTATGGPGIVSSLLWSPSFNMSCSTCVSPKVFADTMASSIKQVIARSNFGCTDTAYATINVPPYNDFGVVINKALCAGTDSIRLNFTISNAFKRGVIPKGLSVAFYNSNPQNTGAILLAPIFTIADTVFGKQATFSHTIKAMPTGQLYAVVNNIGQTTPAAFPATSFLEKSYVNNFAVFNYQRLTVTAVPAVSVMEPGDTLLLSATSTLDSLVTYQWSNPANLSCSNCADPSFITPFALSDSSLIKTVIATNNFGCKDTTSVQIKIPPYNDYSVVVNELQCAGTDSIFIKFTVNNLFKRGVIPRGLQLAFYNGNPLNAGAVLLPPVYKISDTVFAKQATFSTFIKRMAPGNLYVSVNDNGSVKPVVYPVTFSPEKSYANNIFDTFYTPEVVIIQPIDTTVFRKQNVTFSLGTPVYSLASTIWASSTNTLSCSNCLQPTMQLLRNDTVHVQTENKYQCIIKGQTTVKIFPADMTVKILDTKCYTNTTTQVKFTLCMNNGYDSVFKNIPVAFYDDDPARGGRLMSPVYYTPDQLNGNCNDYTAYVKASTTGKLFAVVNDKGNTPPVISPQYAETDTTNNTFLGAYVPFEVSINPSDTTISRWGNLIITPTIKGGTLTFSSWSPAQFLSCINCATPVASPRYQVRYQLYARNEFSCTDTAVIVVKTITGKGVFIPDGFTPNNDGLNDVVYVMTSADYTSVKSFSIFNRWGGQIFQVQNAAPNNPAFGWDGTVKGVQAASGTYVYYAQVLKADGKVESYKGTVVLIR